MTVCRLVLVKYGKIYVESFPQVDRLLSFLASETTIEPVQPKPPCEADSGTR
jgi:hypothetical protein